MLDAFGGEIGQRARQRHRIGRGHGTGTQAFRPFDAERADRGGLEAGGGPDLPGEAGGRGLAVGAGHGRHGLRLRAMELGGQQRQATARVLVDQHRHGGIGMGGGTRNIGQDGGGATADRLGDEAAAIMGGDVRLLPLPFLMPWSCLSVFDSKSLSKRGGGGGE